MNMPNRSASRGAGFATELVMSPSFASGHPAAPPQRPYGSQRPPPIIPKPLLWAGVLFAPQPPLDVRGDEIEHQAVARAQTAERPAGKGARRRQPPPRKRVEQPHRRSGAPFWPSLSRRVGSALDGCSALKNWVGTGAWRSRG